LRSLRCCSHRDRHLADNPPPVWRMELYRNIPPVPLCGTLGGRVENTRAGGASHPFDDFLYRLFYLRWSFPEQILLSELSPESRSVVPDHEIVQTIEAFVIDFRITEPRTAL